MHVMKNMGQIIAHDPEKKKYIFKTRETTRRKALTSFTAFYFNFTIIDIR